MKNFKKFIILSFVLVLSFGHTVWGESYNLPYTNAIRVYASNNNPVYYPLENGANVSGLAIKHSIGRHYETLEDVDFSFCRFDQVDIGEIVIKNSSFRNAVFNRCFIIRSIEDCDLTDAVFRDCEQIEIDGKSFVQTQNYKSRRLEGMRLYGGDYTNIDFSNFYMERTAIIPKKCDGICFKNTFFGEGCIIAYYGNSAQSLLQETINYQQKFWFSMTFRSNLAQNVDFSGMTFAHCRFDNVRGSNFTDAKFFGCFISSTLTLEQVKSTWNYKTGNMHLSKWPKHIEKALEEEEKAKAQEEKK